MELSEEVNLAVWYLGEAKKLIENIELNEAEQAAIDAKITELGALV